MLDDIVANKLRELPRVKSARPIDEVKRAILDAPVPRDFHGALRRPGLSVIAEVKRRSPGAGSINETVDPAEQAATYSSAGAVAVSVLTDSKFFGGSADDLSAVRARVEAPVLRKDFVIDSYQVWEARALGADAVLLIVAALDKPRLVAFQQLARDLGLAALVEVHNEAEVETALAAGARLIGINNRDLQTMTVDVGTTARLRPLIPAEVTLVSESGLRTADDVARVAEAGIDAVLVGEALMASDDPAALLRSFTGTPARA
ncbi:MAG: indole-3-glycerol phosphate synthase TrpC [Chloroflexi bacterium]|nr:indole-3-glycerol phosphate synthase TrpC [Chloroflexota bacterium]